MPSDYAMPNTLEHRGWLIVGHGTRSELGQAEFRQVAQQLAENIVGPVEHAFLELAQPTIAEGVRRLAELHVREIVVVPLLLFTAGHAKQDIPVAVAEAARVHGLRVVAFVPAIERQEYLLELSCRRFHEAYNAAVAPGDTRLVMVGRGSGDPLAIEAMHAYASDVTNRIGIASSVGFVAVAQPSVPQALQAAAEQRPRQIVVLPHLLFQGDVLGAIHKRAAEMRRDFPKTAWHIASHLGVDRLVIEAVLARIHDLALPS